MQFFTLKQQGSRPDGEAPSSSTADRAQNKPKTGTSPHNSGSPDSSQSYPPPVSVSPAKAKFRLDGAGYSPAPIHIMNSGDDTRELPDFIESFPTKHQPVMDTVLKDVLLSLRNSLQADLMNCMHRFNNKIQAVESRVEHIEHKMGEYASTINDLVDYTEEKEGDTEWIKAKLADIEDRSRRNNMKIRGSLSLFSNLICDPLRPPYFNPSSLTSPTWMSPLTGSIVYLNQPSYQTKCLER